MIIHDRRIKKFRQRMACGFIIIICVFSGEYIYQSQLKKGIVKKNKNNVSKVNSITTEKKSKDLSIVKHSIQQP
ncbi:MAG: hypothetical protein JWP67_604 [Mucilaginibacter sp.]|nr:hypothetical protein [Mucilaginibacter sp.]